MLLVFDAGDWEKGRLLSGIQKCRHDKFNNITKSQMRVGYSKMVHFVFVSVSS